MNITTLEQFIQRRNQVAQEVERLIGRRDQAKKTLEEIQAESRARNIDPERIDQILKDLWDRYNKRVSELDAKIAQCAESLTQYTTRVNR